MVRMSSGLENALMTNSGLAQVMNFGVIDCYSGPPPDRPDLPATGTLIGRVTDEAKTFTPNNRDAGLELRRVLPGILQDKGQWKLRAASSGEIGWWRWRWNQFDPDTESVFYPRVDGLVDDSLVLAANTVAKGDIIDLQQFIVRFRSGE